MLHLLAVDTRSVAAIIRASADLIAALVVNVLDVEGMDVAGEVAAALLVLSMTVSGLVMRTYPRIVSAMLIRTSAPQPATMKTPTGGTGVVSVDVWVVEIV